MLSYRHSFHAGNFADVLKHIVLIETLQHFIQKDKAFSYIDTHAGAGLYSLQSEHANKTGEYRDGIGKLYNAKLPALSSYLDVVRQFNRSNTLNRYPGSPMIAAQFLRPQDMGWLFELHPTDFPKLRDNCASQKRLRVQQEDGFKNLLALLPPPSRRGLVLIDPSYEVKSDYETVASVVAKAYKKFNSGTYAIWYPVVLRQQIQRLEKSLIRSGIKNMQCFELGLSADNEGRGMTASGMIVINPPWTLRQNMQSLLPQLVQLLAAEHGVYRCDVLVPE